MNAGFAVVDVETTGLFPGSHRVAEIAVVYVEADGTVSNRWETLVNPQRDLGPSTSMASERQISCTRQFSRTLPRT